ncbi:hypothetical protein O181_043417 [Austropuccinia psidii MF-1]|uniref:Transcription initiation factor IIA subunit 1 n=1 Tax=Austropuccinia psidii MF-1 TaxID=1389203 RepID=A0A9Q3DPS3_9BASI|nr:hypothetical protein [Austropuccinia psidii MF-1]
MSAKVTPLYRSIIDEVVSHCRSDFDEMGIEQAVLDALQASWETKLANTRVADFSGDPRLGAIQASLGPALPKADEFIGEAEEGKISASETKLQNVSTSNKRADKIDRQTDEINSDLDDSEDEADAADVEDNENGGSGVAGNNNPGDLVIALYDKVQRVKNKWKITLKDGIISVKGKDYAFHKCNGEFEW